MCFVWFFATVPYLTNQSVIQTTNPSVPSNRSVSELMEKLRKSEEEVQWINSLKYRAQSTYGKYQLKRNDVVKHQMKGWLLPSKTSTEDGFIQQWAWKIDSGARPRLLRNLRKGSTRILCYSILIYVLELARPCLFKTWIAPSNKKWCDRRRNLQWAAQRALCISNLCDKTVFQFHRFLFFFVFVVALWIVLQMCWAFRWSFDGCQGKLYKAEEKIKQLKEQIRDRCPGRCFFFAKLALKVGIWYCVGIRTHKGCFPGN